MGKIKNAILLAGGTGSRLRNFTKVVSKQLLYINGKVVLDFPLETLKRLGVENVTIVLGSSFAGQIIDYVEDGNQYGLNCNFIYQKEPRGISQACNLAKRFVADDDKFILILGDNWFSDDVNITDKPGAQITLYKDKDLHRFGVASIKDGEIKHIEEKPKNIDYSYDNYAITGLYVFDQMFFEYFKNTKPSAREEYEIAHIIGQYHKAGTLSYNFCKHWMDMGTHRAVEEANRYFLELKGTGE